MEDSTNTQAERILLEHIQNGGNDYKWKIDNDTAPGTIEVEYTDLEGKKYTITVSRECFKNPKRLEVALQLIIPRKEHKSITNSKPKHMRPKHLRSPHQTGEASGFEGPGTEKAIARHMRENNKGTLEPETE